MKKLTDIAVATRLDTYYIKRIQSAQGCYNQIVDCMIDKGLPPIVAANFFELLNLFTARNVLNNNLIGIRHSKSHLCSYVVITMVNPDHSDVSSMRIEIYINEDGHLIFHMVNRSQLLTVAEIIFDTVQELFAILEVYFQLTLEECENYLQNGPYQQWRDKVEMLSRAQRTLNSSSTPSA